MALTFPQKLPVNIKRCPSDGTTVKQQESLFVILFSFKKNLKNQCRVCSQRTCREVRRWLFSWSPEVDPHLYTEQQRDCEKRSTRCTWITHHLMRMEAGDMHRRVTSESSGSTWSAEPSACGCSPEKGRQSPCGAERSNSAWPLSKSTVTNENVCFDLLVCICLTLLPAPPWRIWAAGRCLSGSWWHLATTASCQSPPGHPKNTHNTVL